MYLYCSDVLTFKEFKTRFTHIKAKGFIPSLRKGNTGIGYTFEEALGLKENNLALPDINNIEIKCHRENSGSLITLFTFNNKVWVMNPLDAVKKYGSKDEHGRLGMYYTMSLQANSAGLFLNVKEDHISVQHTSGQVIATWQLKKLAERCNQKIPALLFVSARTEERAGKEWFHFYRAQLMKGTNMDLLKDLFMNGVLLLDLRLHEKETSARNHGTGFRISEDNLPKLFNSVRDI